MNHQQASQQHAQQYAQQHEQAGQDTVTMPFATSMMDEPVSWQFSAHSNNHWALIGGSGSGKTTACKLLLSQLLESSDDIQIHILDFHGEYQDFQQAYRGQRIRGEQSGIPFSLLANPRNIIADIQLKNLLNDFLWAGSQMGNRQVAKLEKLLQELTHGSKTPSNLELRRALDALPDDSFGDHLACIKLLLRSDQPVPFTKSLIVHDLKAFDDIPESRAFYAISLLRYLKNLQMMDSQRPVVIVFEEAKLLMRAKGSAPLERFFSESRKLNMAGVFINQELTSTPGFVIDNVDHQLLPGGNGRAQYSYQKQQQQVILNSFCLPEPAMIPAYETVKADTGFDPHDKIDEPPASAPDQPRASQPPVDEVTGSVCNTDTESQVPVPAELPDVAASPATIELEESELAESESRVSEPAESEPVVSALLCFSSLLAAGTVVMLCAELFAG